MENPLTSLGRPLLTVGLIAYARRDRRRAALLPGSAVNPPGRGQRVEVLPFSTSARRGSSCFRDQRQIGRPGYPASLMVDHIVYGVPDLMPAIDVLEERLGVRAVPGGQHPGRGTHNALLGLGDGTYLELIAVDPDQPDHDAGSLPFALDRARLPRLVGWAVSAPDIGSRVSATRMRGFDPGDVESRSRRQPDGTLLQWQMTRQDPDHLLLPFLIEWEASPHPSQTSPPGVHLVEVRAEHPDPASVRPALAALGVELVVDQGTEPALIAVLDTPRGRVTLR